MKTLKMMGVVSLVLGFLWLGVPKCSEVDYLDKQERQWVERLCREVRSEYFFEPAPDKMSAAEWRAVIGAYRAAEQQELATLEKRPEAFESLTDPVLRRLAERLRG